MKKRPIGRRAAREKAATDHVRMKKVKLAERALRLQEAHVEQITRRNENLLFTSGPTGSSSELARQYFVLRQKEVMEKLVAKQAGLESSGTEQLDVLASAAGAKDGEEET